ncbi:armadillo-type protein [Cladorrhinum sp. PSN259]|nr:armadillo-type protein [Cladorrhinum sp. PSN259]
MGSIEPARQILDQLKAGDSDNVKLEDCHGHIAEICRDEDGADFLSSQLATASHLDKGRIIAEIVPDASELSRDQHGWQVISNALSLGSTDSAEFLSRELVGSARESLFYNQHGDDLLDVILQQQSRQDWESVRDLVLENFVSFSTDSNALRSVKTAIKYWPGDEWTLLTSHLQSEQGLLPQLLVNNDGCEVIRYILEVGAGDERRSLVDAIRPHLGLLGDLNTEAKRTLYWWVEGTRM